MLNRGGAACAAILVLAASIGPAAAQMQVLSSNTNSATEIRIETQDVDWSDPRAVERVHKQIQRAARRLCDVPGANMREIERCEAQTVATTISESGIEALQVRSRVIADMGSATD